MKSGIYWGKAPITKKDGQLTLAITTRIIYKKGFNRCGLVKNFAMDLSILIKNLKRKTYRDLAVN